MWATLLTLMKFKDYLKGAGVSPNIQKLMSFVMETVSFRKQLCKF